MQPGTAETGGKTTTPARTSRVAQLGGPVNAGLAVTWLITAAIGAILVMAGLSALQNYVNAATMPGTAPAWWGEANFARLGEGTIFRFSWWTWAWTIIVLVTAGLAFASGVVAQARIPLTVWAAIAALLCMISANASLDFVSQHVSQANTSAARCAAAGYIISALSFLAFIYNVGLLHY